MNQKSPTNRWRSRKTPWFDKRSTDYKNHFGAFCIASGVPTTIGGIPKTVQTIRYCS
jgi:hypothetical protein